MRYIVYIAMITLFFGSLPTTLAGTVFHLSFEGDVLDASGSGNDGARSGGSFTNNGKFGQALELNASNEHVNMGNLSAMRKAGSFSVSFWFNRDNDRNDNTNHGINNVILAHSFDGRNDNFEIGSDGSNIEFYIDSDSGDNTTIGVNAGIQNDTWYHVALTYDKNRANEVELFVDGVSKTKQSRWSGNLRQSTSTSPPLTIGLARPSGSQWGDFDGRIDEVYLFDNALSAEEVSNLQQFNNLTNVVPEPSSVWLLVLGVIGIGPALRRLGR